MLVAVVATVAAVLAAFPSGQDPAPTAAATPPLAPLPTLADCDLVFTTPSADASGSMPIGNGEVGCSVWFEPDGALRFYVARTDAFSEASRLQKLGLVTVRVRRPVAGEFFEQRLSLADGCITVTLGSGERRLRLSLFVDSAADVVHVVGESARPETAVIECDSWRRAERRLRGELLDSSWTMKGAPDDVAVVESADQRVFDRGAELSLGFVHRNASSVVAFTAARQGLEPTAVADPLLHRAFGVLARCAGAGAGSMTGDGPLVALTARGTAFALHVAAPCVQDADPAAWRSRAESLLAAADSAVARARTAAWWAGFWQRSWIFVRGDAAAAPGGVPGNDHPLRIGVDSGGGNRFVGSIERVVVADGDRELFAAAPATALPLVVAPQRALAFATELRIRATLQQDGAHPIGRIVDKLTAGSGDGFLFDTHPGRSLRLIVGARELVAKDVLAADRRHAVEASFELASGRMQIRCDGKVVASSDGADPVPVSRLSQALALQRWVQASGGRGAFPIKFNGSIFTVEPQHSGGPQLDADWRKWGDCFWWQNTRLPYYPMLAQGDFEQQDPLFRFYRRTLPVAEHRVRQWHPGAAGAYWPETMTPFGTHANGDYGWQRQGQPASKVLCPWWEYARNQGLELLALLLDRVDHEPDAAFVRDELLPVAVPVLAWFATAYPRGATGRLRIAPTQAAETYWYEVEDDMPTVAGLHCVLPRLLALAEALPGFATPEQVAALRAAMPLAQWRELQAALPPVPVREQDGVRMLAPAGRYRDQRSNCENPELYAVFPFRLYGLGKPELELARAAYQRRRDRFANGWPQDGQLAALLGYVDDARANVLARLQNSHRGHRFPATWGPNFDWLPDQCHGSNLLDTVQRMLLQCDGDRILLLPCWPQEWDVAFCLHAPQRTRIECVHRQGRIERLVVTPAARRRDVVAPGPLPR